MQEQNAFAENGTHGIYVNTAVDGKNDIAELMQYFKKQAEIQTASNFPKNGVSVDIIARSIPSLTYEFTVELSKKILQPGNA